MKESKPSLYVIRSTDEADLYWSNTYGWTSLERSTKFTEIERRALRLPTNGEWERY